MRVSRKTPKAILDWLVRGLEKPGKTGKGLATVLGVSESVVSRMRQGLRLVRVADLPKIADYIEEDIPAGYGAAEIAASQSSSVVERLQAVPLVKVLAVIAPAVWREVGALVAVTERVPADPRIPSKQYAAKIEAESGRYAICVPYGDIRPRPMANDAVHVRRTSRGHYEDTIRIIRIGRDGQIHLELAGAKDKSARLDYPAKDKLESIEIKGLVVGYYHANVL